MIDALHQCVDVIYLAVQLLGRLALLLLLMARLLGPESSKGLGSVEGRSRGGCKTQLGR